VDLGLFFVTYGIKASGQAALHPIGEDS